MKKCTINFSQDINLKLQELKKELNIPMNKIILMLINEKLEDLRRVDKIFLKESENRRVEKESAKTQIKDLSHKEIDGVKQNSSLFGQNKNFSTEIRFKISNKEKIFLENQLKKTGNKSLTSEIRYRLINSIYKNKYFLPIELDEFRNLTYQLKKIGININGIFKRVNIDEKLKKDDYVNLENSIKEVNSKIDLITNELKAILKFANNRE